MDVLLLILSFACIVVGFIGSVAPVLPGPPIAWVGILLLHFTSHVEFSNTVLVTLAGLVILSVLLDYVVPIWGTKVFGGTRWGIWGSIVGLIAGIFMGIIGIVVGPFLGAVAFELIGGQDLKKAIKSGWGSFVGFLLGTAFKLTVCSICAYYFLSESFGWFKHIIAT